MHVLLSCINMSKTIIIVNLINKTRSHKKPIHRALVMLRGHVYHLCTAFTSSVDSGLKSKSFLIPHLRNVRRITAAMSSLMRESGWEKNLASGIWRSVEPREKVNAQFIIDILISKLARIILEQTLLLCILACFVINKTVFILCKSCPTCDGQTTLKGVELFEVKTLNPQCMWTSQSWPSVGDLLRCVMSPLNWWVSAPRDSFKCGRKVEFTACSWVWSQKDTRHNKLVCVFHNQLQCQQCDMLY